MLAADLLEAILSIVKERHDITLAGPDQPQHISTYKDSYQRLSVTRFDTFFAPTPLRRPRPSWRRARGTP